jgi:6-phosphogluconolactonase
MDDETLGNVRTYAAPPAADLGEPEIVIEPDPEAVSRSSALRIVEALKASIEARGVAHWATTGGSNPIGIYQQLAVPPLRGEVDWSSVHLWWGDDRYVPRDHPLSNILIADQALLAASARAGVSGWGESGIDVDTGHDAGVDIPPGNIHPFPCSVAIGQSRGPEWCAVSYAAELRQLPVENGWPVFDLVLLGVGPDGHILSVFADSEALLSRDWALAIPAPTHVEPHVPRVTLNPAILDVARSILVVCQGASKADTVATIFGEQRDPRRWPAQLARRSGATWVLDEAAARTLPRG